MRTISALILTLSCLTAQAQKGALIDHTTEIEIFKWGMVKEESFLYEIQDKEADWIAEVSIPWHGSKAAKILEAYVMDRNGKIVRKLKKKDIEISSNLDDWELFSDSYVSRFRLNYHQYPYRIYFKFRSSTSNWIGTPWYPLWNKRVPTVKASLTLKVHNEQQINLTHHPDLQYKVDTIENIITHHWTATDLPVYAQNTFSPPFWEIVPQVHIVPETFEYGVPGSYASWETYGEWITNLNKDLDVLPESERMKVRELTAGINDQKEIIKILYHYLQDNHRYIYVGIEIGGLKPYPASHVVDNRYGDCKALTNFMKSMLAEVGIDSYYTTVYAGENPVNVDPSLPSHQSNHVILCVPLEQDTAWLENTSNCSPFNYLGTFTQNRLALLVNGADSKLVKTPPLTIPDVLNERRIIFDMNGEEPTAFEYTATLRGDEYESMNYRMKNTDSEWQEKGLRSITPIRNASIENWEVLENKRTEPSLKIRGTLTVPTYTSSIGNLQVTPLPPLDFPDIERPEKREMPLRFAYPIARCDTIVFRFQEDKKIRIPEDFHLKSKFGKYEVTTSMNESVVQFIRRFEIQGGDYPLSQYSDFYAFIQQIRKSEKQALILIDQ